MHFLAKGAIYRLLFMAFNFLIGLLIARISDRHEFGVITLMITNAAVFHIIAGLGTDQALIWHGAGKTFDSNKLFTFTALTVLLEFFIFFVASMIYKQNTGRLLLSQQESSFFNYELVYFIGLVLLDKYSALMYASQDAIAANRFLTFSTLLLLAALSVLIMASQQTLASPLKLYCLLIFIQSMSIVIFYHIKNSRLAFSLFSKENLRSFFYFSILVFFTNLIQFIAYRLDYWLIDYYWKKEALGIYGQAGRFAQLMWVLPNVLAALATPVLLSSGNNYGPKDIAELLRKLNLYNLFISAVILAASLFLYEFFLPQYSSGFQALLLMIPGYYFFCTTLLIAAFFSARRMLWINFIASVCCLLVILLFDLLLIPTLSINGAAIANTIAYLCSAILNIFFFTKYTGIRVAELFRFSMQDWKLPGKKLVQ